MASKTEELEFEIYQQIQGLDSSDQAIIYKNIRSIKFNMIGYGQLLAGKDDAKFGKKKTSVLFHLAYIQTALRIRTPVKAPEPQRDMRIKPPGPSLIILRMSIKTFISMERPVLARPSSPTASQSPLSIRE